MWNGCYTNEHQSRDPNRSTTNAASLRTNLCVFRQLALVIWIAAITLASDSAMTIARFRPPKMQILLLTWCCCAFPCAPECLPPMLVAIVFSRLLFVHDQCPIRYKERRDTYPRPLVRCHSSGQLWTHPEHSTSNCEDQGLTQVGMLALPHNVSECPFLALHMQARPLSGIADNAAPYGSPN